MPAFKRTLLALATMVAVFFSATPGAAQNTRMAARSQAALAIELRSGDAHRVQAALNELPDFFENPSFKDQVSHEVAMGLIEALEHEAEQFRRADAGEPFDLPIHDQISVLKTAVAALEHPAAIPVLLQTAQYGNRSIDALLGFGPGILPTVLEYANSPECTSGEIEGSLHVLERAVRELKGIDTVIRARIKATAVLYLNGPPDHFKSSEDAYVARWGAMGIAAVLGDPDLKEMVEKLVPVEEERMALSGEPGPNFAEYALERWGR